LISISHIFPGSLPKLSQPKAETTLEIEQLAKRGSHSIAHTPTPFSRSAKTKSEATAKVLAIEFV